MEYQNVEFASKEKAHGYHNSGQVLELDGEILVKTSKNGKLEVRNENDSL